MPYRLAALTKNTCPWAETLGGSKPVLNPVQNRIPFILLQLNQGWRLLHSVTLWKQYFLVLFTCQSSAHL